MAENILTAQHVVKRFGGLTAVNNVDFTIPRHTIVSIIGPNGAGKTTFFNCITGFYQIDEGSFTFDGQRLDGRSSNQITRLGIARTFQNIRLFSNMTATENVMVGEEAHLHATWIGAIFGTKATRIEEAAAEDAPAAEEASAE